MNSMDEYGFDYYEFEPHDLRPTGRDKSSKHYKLLFRSSF